MTALAAGVAAAAAFISFVVSASAGLGGSLVLVPALSLLLGTKEGVALAALLLAANNVFKVIAYRQTLPIRLSVGIVAATVVGAFIGARLLLAAPERLVGVAVVVAMAATFVLERRRLRRTLQASAPALALGSGLTSGFSGTSGPLKGVAVRGLGLDRLHMVGAASMVSLAGDATKTAVFAEASLLGGGALAFAAAAMPLMALGTWAGRRLNQSLGEKAFAGLFWGVMAGYTVRLALAW